MWHSCAYLHSLSKVDHDPGRDVTNVCLKVRPSAAIYGMVVGVDGESVTRARDCPVRTVDRHLRLENEQDQKCACGWWKIENKGVDNERKSISKEEKDEFV